MGSFSELQDLLKFLLANADLQSGICTIPVTHSFNAFEALDLFNPGWRASLEVLGLSTVRILDREACQRFLDAVYAFHILEQP